MTGSLGPAYGWRLADHIREAAAPVGVNRENVRRALPSATGA